MRISVYIFYFFLGFQLSFGQSFHKDSILLVNYKDSTLGIFSREGVRFYNNKSISDLVPYKTPLDPSLDRPISALKPIYIKDKLYFIYPGGGVVYEYLDFSLKRIDAAFKFNNSYNAKVFVYKDQLFSIGGYGFWSGIDFLTQYNEALGTWSIIDTTGELPGSIVQGGMIILNNELWLVSFSNMVTNSQTMKHIPNAYVLNLDTKIWKRKGIINEKFTSLFKEDESYKSIALKDSLYFFSARNSISAKIHIPSNKVILGNTSNRISNITFENQLVSFRDSLYYATYSIQGSKDRVQIVTFDAHPQFSVTDSFYFQRNNAVIILYGSILTLGIITLIFGSIFYLKSRKNKYTLEKGILSNGIKKITVSDIEGAEFFLQELSKKRKISNNDLLSYFNDDSISMDMITKRKNKMIQELETLLYNQFKRILFERLRDPEDHRQAIYKLKKGKSIVCYTTE